MRAIKLVVALLLSVVVSLSIFGCQPSNDSMEEVLHKFANKTATYAYENACAKQQGISTSDFDFEIKKLKIFKVTKIERDAEFQSKDSGFMGAQRFYEVRCRIIYKMKRHDNLGNWEYTRWCKVVVEDTPGTDLHVVTWVGSVDISVGGTHTEWIQKNYAEIIKAGEDMMTN